MPFAEGRALIVIDLGCRIPHTRQRVLLQHRHDHEYVLAGMTALAVLATRMNVGESLHFNVSSIVVQPGPVIRDVQSQHSVCISDGRSPPERMPLHPFADFPATPDHAEH
jgi:hypothetical protein